MKKIISLAFTFIFCTQVFSQVRKEEHLQESKRQNKVGWILVGSGAALIVGGGVIINNVKKNNEGIDGDFITIIGLPIVILGVAVTGASIPFFIRSHKEYKKGLALSIKNEHIQLIQKGMFTRQVYPAIALKINLGR
jgi:amino acid transporter